MIRPPTLSPSPSRPDLGRPTAASTAHQCKPSVLRQQRAQGGGEGRRSNGSVHTSEAPVQISTQKAKSYGTAAVAPTAGTSAGQRRMGTSTTIRGGSGAAAAVSFPASSTSPYRSSTCTTSSLRSKLRCRYVDMSKQ